MIGKIKKYLGFICVLIGLSTSCLLASDKEVIEEMKDQLNVLANEKSFNYVNLGITPSEAAHLNQFNIDNTEKFDQFGKLDLLRKNLAAFINDVGNNNHENVETVTEIITRLVKQVITASGKDSAWVSVRSYTPTPSFDTLRWHIDGADYGVGGITLYPNLTYKFAATLKGPSTLLYEVTDAERDVLISRFDDRSFLSDFLDLSQAESALPGHGVFFVVGDTARGTVHSEPSLYEERLFISIVAGEKLEIEDLYSRRLAQNANSEIEKSWEEGNLGYSEDQLESCRQQQLEDKRKAIKEYQERIQHMETLIELHEQIYIVTMELIDLLRKKPNMEIIVSFYLQKIEKTQKSINFDKFKYDLEQITIDNFDYAKFRELRCEHTDLSERTIKLRDIGRDLRDLYEQSS